MKTAFIFSGQGSQYIGMGKELCEVYPVANQVMEEASEGCQIDLKKQIFEGEKEWLDMTEHTQPSVVAMTMATYAACKSEGLVPDVVAGLSLGEYSALTASGVFTVSKVAGLVRKRGRYMQEAVPVGIGKMIAILNLPEELVREACKRASNLGVVEPANFNCPGQIVIGGEIAAVDEAANIAKEFGAKRTLELSVSAPFHTSMLKPASDRLREEFRNMQFDELQIPHITNVTADYVKQTSEVPELLCKQVMSSVLWEQTIRRMIQDGVTNFVEIGPGKTLTGFMKRIDPSVKAFHIEDVATLHEAIESLSIIA